MLRKILITAGVLVVSACTTLPSGRQQVNLFSDAQLAQMGATAFAQLVQQGDVDRSRGMNRYVECVADAITRQVKDPQYRDWEVVVFDDDSPNAFALPGGKIGVHTGLMKVAQNQDQLAAVIGHEVAHVLYNHGGERLTQSSLAQLGMSVLNAAAPERRQAISLLGAGVQVGVLLPFSRTHESEADIEGLRLMSMAGFDPGASIKLWENMKRASKRNPPEFLSTHPNPDRRIDNLARMLPNARQIARAARANGQTPNCG